MKSHKISLDDNVENPPKGLAIFALVGPSFIWCAEYIGSGEVILATRTGAILGTGVIWAIIIGIFLKYWIGMSGARYTVCTGEAMIDMFDRIPGPRHWVVWIVLVTQFISAAISIGSIATAAGIFLSSLTSIHPQLASWLVTIFCLTIAWTGLFDLLKIIMSFFVLIIVIGALYVAGNVFPGIITFLKGFLIQLPEVPQWAVSKYGINQNPWREILPLLGWAAGGFASQVWYTYWVVGAGYGATRGRGYGVPADVEMLRNMSKKTALKIKEWLKVVYTDATLAMVIGNVVTIGFLIAGAGILGSNQLAPEGPQVAFTLSKIFSSKWGEMGSFLFILSGTAALLGTQIGQLAGWPRLLADSFRICIPAFQKKFQWKTQFRLFLGFFFTTNMIIVFTFGLKPVFLVKMGAVMDGLLLTPLQALWIVLALYIVLPKLLSPQAYKFLRPHWIFGVGLIIAFLVFSYFCIFQIPFIL